jgi:hypothetical protein
MVPSVHNEDPMAIHDQGIRETNDMAQKGKRYGEDKMGHLADGEAWAHFDGIHRDKADEARNVRVALATDGFNPYGLMAVAYTCWLVFVISLNLPPSVCFQ